MQLSRLLLNARSRQARRDLANPYDMHRTLAWAFALGPDEPPARFLWRVEPARPGAVPVVLVQSEVRPQWARLTERFPTYLVAAAAKDYALPGRLPLGAVLRFRVRANPTVTRNGKRHGLRSHADQTTWLHKQGERHGFSVMGCMVSQPSFVRTHQGDTQDNIITVQAVTYDGYLRVDDPETLRQAIAGGLGHAKALGLGLLSVAPASR